VSVFFLFFFAFLSVFLLVFFCMIPQKIPKIVGLMEIRQGQID
jgi:hypothetical protein